MATQEMTVQIYNPYSRASGVPTMGGSGTWTAGTYSLMVVACYNGSDTSELDTLGWSLSTETNWNGFVVGAGDTAKQMTLTWLAAARSGLTTASAKKMPDYYKVLLQTAATYDVAAVGYVCATVAGSVLTATFDYPGISGETLTLAAAYTEIVLCPVTITPYPRDNTVRSSHGPLYRKTFTNNNLYDRLNIQLYGSSCTGTEYNDLCQAARLNIACKLTDGDTTPYRKVWYGMFTQPTSLNSESKNAGYPSLTFVIVVLFVVPAGLFVLLLLLGGLGALVG